MDREEPGRPQSMGSHRVGHDGSDLACMHVSYYLVILRQGMKTVGPLTDDQLKKMWRVCAHSLSRVRLFATQWTVAHQAPLSMGLSWQEHWSGLPLPSPGDLPTQGSNQSLLRLLHLQAGSLSLDHLGSPKDVVHIHNGMLLLLLLPSRFSRV